ncbi:MAG: chemotaxis protein CheW [Thermodesulfobacteriota bacterium]
MIIEDEESLKMYVEESLEHMSNIESNLLAIEKAGDKADAEIVNEVFRAAHSIKGGAGLMGLNNIKDLAHKVENVLGLVREKKIIPDTSIISIVLSAFDKLNSMINNIRESEEVDISEEVVSLTGLTTASLPEAKKSSVGQPVHILDREGGKAVFTITRYDFNEATKGGRELYIIKWDLIQDIHDHEKSLMDMTKSISTSGNVIDTAIDIERVGTLDAAVPNQVPFLILYSTMIGEDILPALFNVSKKNVRKITPKMILSDEEAEAWGGEADEPDPPETGGRNRMASTEPDDTAETKPPLADTASSIADDASSFNNDTETMERESADEEPGETLEAAGDNGVTMEKGDVTIRPSKAQTSLRVDVKLLDSLMTLAGEMVLSRNQLLQNIAGGNKKAIAAAGQRINMVTSELQDVIMKTRMQSIGNIFNKLPRLVRDMSQRLGKKVELTLEGTDVELDKTIIEAISDPLTHLIRNAVDHGIEPAGKRANLGKSPIGKIHLAALHEAGQVSVEITDDGSGIDGNMVAAAAIRKGLISESQAGTMTKKEKLELILLPGFSTAEKVTDVSGRGVGMDVVKTNLDKLGGSMDIESIPGKYTTIIIKLPLTLAIIPSQMVLVGGEKYAIPQVNLDELLRIPADQVKNRIEKVGDAEVVRLRGKLLPLVDLADVLMIEKTYIDPQNGSPQAERRQKIADRRSKKNPLDDESDSSDTDENNRQAKKPVEFHSRRLNDDRRFHATSAINIAVVSLADMKYGLVVHRLLDSEEIVVKPLGRHLKQCQEFSGATIMGDGRVSLILDVAGIAASATLNIVDISRKEKKEEVEMKEAQAIQNDREVASLLIFSNDNDRERFAVSLGLVERIESIKTDAIEHVGGKQIIQYRGGALPLFSMDQVAAVKPLPKVQDLEIIVFTIGGREIGLMVIPPVDAVEVPIHIDSKALKQPGIIGSAIINGRTTLIIDVFEAVKTLFPDWMSQMAQKQQAATGGVSGSRGGTLLFAEDSDFFRRQVKGFLEDGGYRVIEAKNGQEAWSVLTKEYRDIDLIITDLEMPKMNGFELTEKIRSDDRLKHFTVIALTSLAGEADIVRGKQVGINDYQIKMDRGKLLDTVKRHLEKTRP